MLRRYVELKAAHPERVLLYRLGDFFECFFEDAIELSRVLELTLTGKEGGKAIGQVPMAGIPHHAAERYCAELIKQGYSVALCDQPTTPTKGALLKRDITRVLTPGTVLEEGMLSARRNNWLAAVVVEPAQGNNRCAGLGQRRCEHWRGAGDAAGGGSALHQQLAQQEASNCSGPPPSMLSGRRGARNGCGSRRWPAPPSARWKQNAPCNSTTASAASMAWACRNTP